MLPDAQKQPVLDAYAASLSTMWIFYTVTGFICVLCSFCIGKKTLSKEHEEVRTGIAAQEEERVAREDRRKSKRGTKDLEQGGLANVEDVASGGEGSSSVEAEKKEMDGA